MKLGRKIAPLFHVCVSIRCMIRVKTDFVTCLAIEKICLSTHLIINMLIIKLFWVFFLMISWQTILNYTVLVLHLYSADMIENYCLLHVYTVTTYSANVFVNHYLLETFTVLMCSEAVHCYSTDFINRSVFCAVGELCSWSIFLYMIN